MYLTYRTPERLLQYGNKQAWSGPINRLLRKGNIALQRRIRGPARQLASEHNAFMNRSLTTQRERVRALMDAAEHLDATRISKVGRTWKRPTGFDF